MPSRPRLPLRPELLEDRTTPAVITVTSLADNTMTDGLVTLREAVLAGQDRRLPAFAPAAVEEALRGYLESR